MITIKRNFTLTERLMAPRVGGAPVVPGAVVRVSSWAGGFKLLKIRRVEPIKGRQGVSGWTVDESTGLEVIGSNGRRVRSWAYVSQVSEVIKAGKDTK